MAKSVKTLAAACLALLAIIASALPTAVAGTVPTAAHWTAVNIPAQGEAGQWVLAAGSDVQQITVATDGALYAAANPTGTTDRLFRSSDNGSSWQATGEVTGAIISIATTPDDARLVYYATAAGVFRSTDAGATFAPLPGLGGAGGDNRTVTTIAVTPRGSGHLVAAAVRDNDAGQYGGVYLLDDTEVFAAWRDAGIGSLDVVAVSFSPKYATDRALVAVATNESSTLVLTRIGEGGWGMIGPANLPGVVARNAVIAFPDDYLAISDPSTLFVGIDSGVGLGDVYRVEVQLSAPGTTADLNLTIDVSGLLVSGNGTAAYLVAGMAGSAAVSVSRDAGKTWQPAAKSPTGGSTTRLAAAPDFASSRRCYAATTGVESSLSRSDDGGMTWDQVGLIDTEIISSAVLDLAASPVYAQNRTLFMLTWGGEHCLWRTRDGGSAWERVFASAGPEVDSLARVAVSPVYGRSTRVLFVAGLAAGGQPAVWRSPDDGRSFVRRHCPGPVDAWTIAGDDRLFVATYDGSRALVASSEDGGFLYGRGVAVGSQPLNSIVLSPDFEHDKTMAVGNTVGLVYLSRDGGATFQRLGQALPLSPGGAGLVSLAFDPAFASNKLIYAATDAPSTSSSRSRLFRFTVGKAVATAVATAESWEAVDASLPVGGMINRLAVSGGGVLYVANAQAVSAAGGRGGMERSLDPTFSLTPAFETVTGGLNDGTTLVGLWSSGNCLWSIDTANTRPLVYVDTLTQAPVTKGPANGAAGLETTGVRLDWTGLEGATSYEWQVSDSGDFSSVPAGFGDTTTATSAKLPALDLATTYYWRVRAWAPVLSPWSAKQGFATKLGSTAIAPVLQYPPPGASGVPVSPVFQWSAIAGASGYELVVSTNATLDSSVISRTGDSALGSTAWQSDTSLARGATYYWRVRAVGSGTFSAWSGTGAFTTESPTPTAVASPAVTSTTTTSPVPTSPAAATSVHLSLPGWAIALFVLLGLMVVLLLVVVLVLLVRRRNEF